MTEFTDEFTAEDAARWVRQAEDNLVFAREYLEDHPEDLKRVMEDVLLDIASVRNEAHRLVILVGRAFGGGSYA